MSAKFDSFLLLQQDFFIIRLVVSAHAVQNTKND